MDRFERDRMACLAERIAIHIEKGELAMAHALVDRSQFLHCLQPAPTAAVLALRLDELELTPRVAGLLCEDGIETVEDLLERRPADLLEIEGLHESHLMEVYTALGALGLRREGTLPGLGSTWGEGREEDEDYEGA